MTDWANFFDWAAKGILGGICMYGVHILSQMKNSIDSLNEKVARIIERTEWHSKELEKLEERIITIERRQPT
jgi:hypothetical protein